MNPSLVEIRPTAARRLGTVAIIMALGILGTEPAVASAKASRASTVAVGTALAATTIVTSTASAATAAAITARSLAVPLYYQAYTLSCEEAALRMALASEGIPVTDAGVLAIIGSDLAAATWDSSGLRWGDPYKTFVGDVAGGETSLTGYGTYYPTIARAAAALGGTVLAAGEGISAQSVYQYILSGHPVVTWVTYQWVNAQRADYVAYDGRVIPYAGPVEHAVTVVGVTPTDVIVNDPDFGRTVISKTLFEASYATYNNMAVVLR